jgi:hypothetical protein
VLAKKDSLPDYQRWRMNLRIQEDPFVIASATGQLDGNKTKEAGLGLFAKREYAAFEVIGEYLGEIKDTIGDYVLTAGVISGNPFKIDARCFSNVFSRINDGFPNVFLTALSNERGLPFRPILVTLEPIMPGEQFCFNYGWHGVKKGNYVELRPQALRAFLTKHGLADWNRLLAKINPLYVDQISQEEIAFAAQFRYLLQTPKALRALILDETIDSHMAEALVKIAGNGHIPLEDFPSYRALLNDLT